MCFHCLLPVSVCQEGKGQHGLRQAQAGRVADLHEAGRRQVWLWRPLLLCVPQVAPHVQHLLLPGQLQLPRHPPASGGIPPYQIG